MTEHNEQCAFVEYVLLTYQHRADFIRPLFFAVPNGAWLGGSSDNGRFALVRKYRGEGMLPGVADLLYLQPRGTFAFLAIEMKTHARAKEKTGGLTLEQMDWLMAATNAGARAVVAYGADQAIAEFDGYMQLRSGSERIVMTGKGKLIMAGER